MKPHSFNTGRWYCPELQPIDLIIVDDICYFNDKARNITGRVMGFSSFLDVLTPTDNEIESAFMNAYDFGNYTEVSLHTFLLQGENHGS